MARIQFNERMISAYATAELAQDVVRRLKTDWPIEYCADETAQWVFEDADELFRFEQSLKEIYAQIRTPYHWPLRLVTNGHQGYVSLEQELTYQ